MVHGLLQNKLNLSIKDLYLLTSLRMIWCGQFVSYGILLHKSFEGSIARVSAIITEDSTRGSEAREDVLFQILDDNLVVISFAWIGFYPFGHIIRSSQYVLVSK